MRSGELSVLIPVITAAAGSITAVKVKMVEMRDGMVETMVLTHITSDALIFTPKQALKGKCPKSKHCHMLISQRIWQSPLPGSG